ncbi:hypothetical protein GCM10022267_91470 [Lentzea roselyniae]|uniref:Uncharacterized protein n=1 Tax=Lentzea roselyniae TaxID=531940 RepID=A0ABP7CM35_9PSEU
MAFTFMLNAIRLLRRRQDNSYRQPAVHQRRPCPDATTIKLCPADPIDLVSDTRAVVSCEPGHR